MSGKGGAARPEQELASQQALNLLRLLCPDEFQIFPVYQEYINALVSAFESLHARSPFPSTFYEDVQTVIDGWGVVLRHMGQMALNPINSEFRK